MANPRKTWHIQGQVVHNFPATGMDTNNMNPAPNPQYPEPRASGPQHKAQIGIITVREDEFLAVLRRLEGRKTIDGPKSKRKYEYESVATPSGNVGVVVCRCPEQGCSAAQNLTSDLLEDFSPEWLLLVGIAGGFPDSDYSFGDVLVANRLIDFSVTAALEDKTEWDVRGGPPHNDVRNLLAHLPALRLPDWNAAPALVEPRPAEKILRRLNAMFYGPPQWQEKVRAALYPQQNRTQPKVTVKPIASANMLLKNADVAEQWKQVARSLAGVEMELAGVYEAVQNRSHTQDCRLLAIRGISDIVGYQRKPSWTPYACDTAASFALALVAGGHLVNGQSRAIPDSRPPRPIEPVSILSPIASAVLNRNADLLKTLLDNTQEDLASHLILALERGYEDIALFLVAQGADVNAKRLPDGKTALILAVDRGFFELTQTLLDKGADFNVRDAYGSYPLSLAANRDDTLLINLLQTYGAKDHGIAIPDAQVMAPKMGGKIGSVFSRHGRSLRRDELPQQKPRTVAARISHWVSSLCSSHGRSTQQQTIEIVQIGNPRMAESAPPSKNSIGVRFDCSFAAPAGTTIGEAWVEIKTYYINVKTLATIIGFKRVNQGHENVKDDALICYDLGKASINCKLIGSPDWNLEGSHSFEFWIDPNHTQQPGPLRCVLRITAEASSGIQDIREKDFKIFS